MIQLEVRCQTCGVVTERMLTRDDCAGSLVEIWCQDCGAPTYIPTYRLTTTVEIDWGERVPRERTFRQCIFRRMFTDEQGGSQVGVFRMVDYLPFTLAEAEQWLISQSERPCTVHCSTILPEMREALSGFYQGVVEEIGSKGVSGS